MDNHEHHHITTYRSHLTILLILLVLTIITVAITQVHLDEFTAAGAMLIAGIKATIVFAYFMHLKYEKPIFRWMVIGVMVVFIAVILFTFLDYGFR